MEPAPSSGDAQPLEGRQLQQGMLDLTRCTSVPFIQRLDWKGSARAAEDPHASTQVKHS